MGKITLSNDSKVVRSFNNNILLIKENGQEKILFGKGIGFGKRPEEIVKKGTVVEKVFIIENEENQRNFNDILDKVDCKLIALVEEVIAEISDELEEELSENIHIGLIDHLFYAIRRLENNEEIENPFLVEIETLYRREFDMACRLAKRMKEELKVDIPEGEKGFIALHIHCARNNGKLSNTIKYSFLSNSIIEHIEDTLGIDINKKSLDYARFLTHIRFAIERILTGVAIKNDLVDVIKSKYSLSYNIADEVKEIVCKNLRINTISEDEVAYLAMHIERFRVLKLDN